MHLWYTYSLPASVECAAAAGTVAAVEIATGVWPAAVAAEAVAAEPSVAAVAVAAGVPAGPCSGQPSVGPSRR